MNKIFNFNPDVTSKVWTVADVSCNNDITKLCTHKPKIAAMATLQRSTSSYQPAMDTSNKFSTTVTTVGQLPPGGLANSKLQTSAVVLDSVNDSSSVVVGKKGMFLIYVNNYSCLMKCCFFFLSLCSSPPFFSLPVGCNRLQYLK